MPLCLNSCPTIVTPTMVNSLLPGNCGQLPTSLICISYNQPTTKKNSHTFEINWDLLMDHGPDWKSQSGWVSGVAFQMYFSSGRGLRNTPWSGKQCSSSPMLTGEVGDTWAGHISRKPSGLFYQGCSICVWMSCGFKSRKHLVRSGRASRPLCIAGWWPSVSLRPALTTIRAI